MAYGFNLGQIEGLNSSVQTVELALEREGQSLSLTLAYDEGDGWWSDNTHQFVLMFSGTKAFLWLANATESNVGDSYNVNVYTTKVTQSFKSAVEMVLEEIMPDIPYLDNAGDNGTYVLKATRSNNIVTYNWVADT